MKIINPAFNGSQVKELHTYSEMMGAGKGRSSVVIHCGEENGLEVWRALGERCEPRTVQTETAREQRGLR